MEKDMEFYVSHDDVIKIGMESDARGIQHIIADALQTKGIYESFVHISLCYIAKANGKIKCSTIRSGDSNGAIKKMKEFADFRLPVTAHWSVESGSVYIFGTQTNFYGVEYTSDEPYDLPEIIENRLRGQKHALGGVRFELLVLSRNGKLIEIGPANVHEIGKKYIFVNFVQVPYPQLNYTVMKHFATAATPVNPNYYLAMLKKGDQRPFLKKLTLAVTAMRAQYGVQWENRVTAATRELSQWCQTVPRQGGFNAAARSAIVRTVCKHVCLLAGLPMYLGLPQCLGKPPAHMLGSGPVDAKVGAAVINWARDAAAAAEDSDSDDWGQYSEDEEEDSNFPPAVDKNDPFPQLSGACYDAAFVSAAMQQNIAEVTGAAADRDSSASTSNRPAESASEPATEPATRVHLHIGGFLMTGHTLEVLNYSTETLEASAKPSIAHLASLPLHVLRYTEGTSSEMGSHLNRKDAAARRAPGVQESSSSVTGKPGSVDREQVERVLAALLLGAQGRLTAPIEG